MFWTRPRLPRTCAVIDRPACSKSRRQVDLPGWLVQGRDNGDWFGMGFVRLIYQAYDPDKAYYQADISLIICFIRVVCLIYQPNETHTKPISIVPPLYQPTREIDLSPGLAACWAINDSTGPWQPRSCPEHLHGASLLHRGAEMSIRSQPVQPPRGDRPTS